MSSTSRTASPFKTIDGAEVAVRGWPTMAADADKKRWIADFSDHALLYSEVQVP
jgi:hypothetical protein